MMQAPIAHGARELDEVGGGEAPRKSFGFIKRLFQC